MLNLTLLHSSVHGASNKHYEAKIKQVAYNWEYGGPKSGFKDNFTARFDQSQYLAGGDYFIQAMADTGIRISVDGKKVIDRWSYKNEIYHSLLFNVSKGDHKIITDYREVSGKAFIFSHIAPFGSWVAYYYKNSTLSGNPYAAEIIPSKANYQLYKEYGYNSPAKNIPEDYFSARYITYDHIPAGDYVIRARADDGIQVYIDDKLVLDRFTGSSFREDAVKVTIKNKTSVKNAKEKDVHKIEIRYKDHKGFSKIDFSLQPYKEASSITPSDGWFGEIYNNRDFSGKPVILGGKGALSKINNLNFDWGSKSPSPLVNVDNFSAIFKKKINVPEKGYYIFEVDADTGAKLFVDGKLVVDSWKYTPNKKTGGIILEPGDHTIQVNYIEYSGRAKLKVNMIKGNIHKNIKQKSVHYNWGTNSPDPLMPKDHFTMTFDQSQTLKNGDYFVHAWADTGIRIDVNGKRIIDQWSYKPEFYRSLLLNVKQGDYKIITNFREVSGNASIFSDIVPFGDWIAYYYNNTNLSGQPIAAKVIPAQGTYGKLIEDNGTNSPVPGIVNSDYFSARYITAKRIPAGEYVVRAKADTGVQVYIDGKLVLDHFSSRPFNEDGVKINITDDPSLGNVHWIEVRYKEYQGKSNIQFFIQPYNDATNISVDDGWLAEVYNNKTFSGNPVVILGGKDAITPLKELGSKTTDWGTSSPSRLINNDHFSIRFQKKYQISSPGYYVLKLKADTGARVYLNGNSDPIIDSWNYTPNEKLARVYLNKGIHDIRIDYYEHSGKAKISFELTKAKGPVYLTKNYNYTLDDMVKKQLSVKPKTDKYMNVEKWIAADALKKNSNGDWIIVGYNWNVRTGPGSNYSIIGQLSQNDPIKVIGGPTKGGEYEWYKILATWITVIHPEDVRAYVDPNRFKPDTKEYFQFLKLSLPASINKDEVNEKILYNKGILKGRAGAFIQAGEKYNINEIYLISHALLETGNGTSQLANGVPIKVSKDNKGNTTIKIINNPKSAEDYDMKVYNMYGINAVDANPLQGGVEYAYQQGWTSPDKAIIEGAKFIAEKYIHVGQDTLYKMRWNPDNPGTHQYATDIGWAVKQVSRMKELYDLLADYQLVFEVPKYK